VGFTAGSREVPGRKDLRQETSMMMMMIMMIIIIIIIIIPASKVYFCYCYLISRSTRQESRTITTFVENGTSYSTASYNPDA
jgi:capsule polysaccharide export protein KpsE/RkpR